MDNKYYLHVKSNKENYAASKAVLDCESILEENGFEKVSLYQNSMNNKAIRDFAQLVEYIPFFIKVKGTLVIEYPIYKNHDYLTAIKCLKTFKKVQLIFIIHDLNMIRYNTAESKKHDFYVKMDMKMLKLADYIIVHNNIMKEYLLKHTDVEANKLIVLGIFDYLVNDIKNETLAKDCDGLVVAGNLSDKKSGYIYNLGDTLKHTNLNLYGSNYIEYQNKMLQYKGSIDADILPSIIEGKYGLVWDGPSINTCEGDTGNYLRYNNPHKLSLYIASKLPIIIWSGAALAKFVVSNKIGLEVDSLVDIENRLAQITEKEYLQYKNNITYYSERVKTGYYLKHALKQCGIIFYDESQ